MIDQKDTSVTPAQANTYSQNEENLNAISHAFGLLLGCIGLFLLLQNSHGDISRIVSFTVFATSSILLFLASTIYHNLTNKRAKNLFKLLDHCAIYLLIAGTYTRYHSKCRISVGIKMTLGKLINLNIVTLCFDYLTPRKGILNPSQKRLSSITPSLL